ncbi:N6-adenosine-methyltransferase non-catalytic subunit MTB isoform X1 [Cryptomeria japonica]|uniref:N6-adenosine-methyltransferase non-catalytic subunit MTB isoform X1 n=1 Tax=Cryptomeria japonica TaxID=3369 RepID=UPI0027DA7891|nr:N6-adenosine-methyltransferase non-catalytic subunit MTB isoform X1 [Cryptomeria japonica]XP_057862991.2 N6-adenosine-methyltransferase non-catalytic subunit MTB isoform X1 [Cryptomeria japonica]XP_057862992.2 N6-adenosine-methyltransferase non-catalytic subunit MTB isoform X1 [Cryptomeria japonica]
MDISESSTRHYEKRRSTVESPESPRDRDRDGEDEDWDVSERRRDRHRSSKSRKRGNPDEYSEDWQQTGSRRKSGSGKKKLVTASSGRAGSGDEDEYDDKGVIGPRSDDYGTRGSNADNKRDRDKLDKKSSSGYQDATRKMKEENAGAKPEDDRSRQHAFTDYDRNLPRKATGTIRAGKTETTAVKAASGYETSQSRNRGKTSDFYRESDAENAPQERGIARQGSDDTARYTERKGSGKEKGQGGKGSSKYEKDDNGRRWDEADYSRSTPKVVNEDLDIDKGDRRVGRGREKLGGGRERENETNDFPSKSKSRFGEALTFHNEGKPARASDRDERRTEEAERRPKGKGRLEMHADDEDANKAINMDKLDDKQQRRIRDTFDSMAEDFESWEKSGGQRQSFKVQEEKSERHKNFREYGHGRWDEAENWDIQDNEDEHVERGRMKEKRDMGWEDIEDRGRSGRGRSGRGVRHMKRSWSPEGRKRARRDSEEFDREFSDDRGDSDTERSISLKGKDRDRDVYREDRPREKDSDWMERSRDWEGSKDHRKSRYYDRHDKDLKGEEGDYDFERDWEFHGRERERLEREKVQRVVTDRKDRGRLEGVKSVTSFGSSNDALDRRAGSLDYGRGDSGSAFGSSRRNDIGGPSDFMGEGDWGFPPDDRGRMGDVYAAGIDSRERYDDDAPPGLDQNFGMNPGRITPDGSNMHGGRGRGHKGSLNNRGRGAGQMGNGGQSSFGSNQGSGSFTRMMQQGGKGGRGGRGRGRVQGRDTQRGGIPLPMMGPGPGPGVPAMGPPFGPLGLPPGALQAMGPGMGPAPGPPMGPGGFLPPPYAAGHMVWGGGRGGGEMNILAVPPGLSPVPPPGPSGPRFVPNMGPGPNQGVYFNQPGPVRGASPNMSGAGYGSVNPMGRGMVNEKANVGRVPPRITGPPGKAPSRGEQNDYSQNFVDTGMRPQNFIRELELTNVVEDYPKLRELIQKKDEIVAKSACPPMYLKCDLRETVLAPELFGTKFDVILVDPPWEEYVHRAPGVGDHMEYWTFEEIQNIKIEAIADTPSFIFLWVGDGVGLEQGRLCLKKWGFRRCEDICWVKTNKANPSPGLRHDSHTLFQHSKEHCLMGIKGTVRRSTDGHIIHANIDTDIIIAEEPPQGSTTKPEDLYRIIEHFALGRRRLELFGEDHNIRAGWLTVGKGLSSSNFNSEGYIKNFLDKDGKVWQGGAGRNPPPDAPHLVGTSPEIESLRPKSPPQKSQQQQTNSVSQPAANSTSKKASSTSPGPAQNTQPSAVATSVGGSAQEVQVSNALGSVPALPVSEMSRTGSSVPINEQRPVPVHPSSSKTSSMGPRAGLEVDGSTEEEKFLDAGTPGNLDSQK